MKINSYIPWLSIITIRYYNKQCFLITFLTIFCYENINLRHYYYYYDKLCFVIIFSKMTSGIMIRLAFDHMYLKSMDV